MSEDVKSFVAQEPKSLFNPLHEVAAKLTVSEPVALARTATMPEGVYADAGGPAWSSDPAIAFEGVPTGDKRIFELGAVSWRELPLPFMWQKPQGEGHDAAVVVGRIEKIDVSNDGRVTASGHLLDTPEAKEYENLLASGSQPGVSVDLGKVEYEVIILAVDEDGWPTDWEIRFSVAEIAGLTAVSVPAFADARIRIGEEKVQTSDALIAAAAPARPPRAWFSNPQLTEPTPWTITDDGRIFGHIATWGQCHIGFPDVCVTAPNSNASYGYFTTGELQMDDGTVVPVGTITMNTGHASMQSDPNAAVAHYDNTGLAAAYVVAGEDEHGIWIAGSVKAGLTPEDVRTLRASAPSGDWRRIGGSLEMVAVLAVNHPGFPLARVASGAQLALVACASPMTQPAEAPELALEDRVAAMELKIAQLSELTTDAQLAQLDKMIS